MATPSAKVVIFSGMPLATQGEKSLLIGFLLGKLNIQKTPEMRERVYMPIGDQQLTHGFAVIKFSSDQQAENVITSLNGVVIDRGHTFVVEQFRSSTIGSQVLAAGHIDPAILDELEEVDVESDA